LRTPDGVDAALRDCWPQSFQHNTAYNLIQQLTTGRKAASETELSVEAAVWYLIAIFGQLLQTSVSRQRDGGHFMKIQWNFADGTTSEVEVNEELGAFITASRRDENNLNRKERYHCYSLDAILFEGKEYGDNHTPETEVETAERNKRLYAAMKTLTAVQQKRLLMLADGLSLREIARVEGVDHRAVRESIDSAKKKFKKVF
jgi:DNA-binding CsgD family transcriptional regulator